MKFKVHIEHDKWIFIEHERTGTYFTIESEENTMSPNNWMGGECYNLISCPVTTMDDFKGETVESSECWSKVEDLSEMQMGEISYLNILFKRLFRREILISNKTIGQRGVSLTY